MRNRWRFLGLVVLVCLVLYSVAGAQLGSDRNSEMESDGTSLVPEPSVPYPPPDVPDPPPNPIDPNNAQQRLIDLLASLPINGNESALDNFPLPYAILAAGGDADPQVFNKKAGSPVQIDADQDTDTGQGNSGHDFVLELNTELFPTPHLRINVERLGEPPYAENITLLVNVPWNAFNDEDLPDRPNLFFGFQTTDVYDILEQEYPEGGNVPQSLEFRFIPDILAGTDHDFEVLITTLEPDNPVRFIAGHLDGTAETGIQNMLGLAAHTDPVPETISLGFDIGNTALFMPTFQTSFDLSWEASEPARVMFDYIENESYPFVESEFGTSLTFEDMPTSELISLMLDTSTATATLQHNANAVIDEIALVHRRADELTVIGTATDVPTALTLGVDLSGAVTLDVNANTLDLDLKIIETEGFPGTDGFFGYDLGFVSLAMENVPDMTAGYFPLTDSFSVETTNPGECVGCDAIELIELVIDDNAILDGNGNVQGLDLPTSWGEGPTHDIFSIVDNGSHGTAAARVLFLETAEYSFDAAIIAESWELTTTQAAPMQAYLRTSGATNLIPGRDIEITCDVDDFPAGVLDFDFDLPQTFMYSITPPQDIEQLHCFGFIDTLNFDVAGADLPPVLEWDFDPEEHLDVRAENGSGPNSDSVGLFAVRLWDETQAIEGTTGILLGDGLMDARARVDEVPSFHSSWADGGGGSSIGFDSGNPGNSGAFLGGAQVAVSTIVELTNPLPDPAGAPHYVRFTDMGPGNPKALAAGLFGIDEFSYLSNEGAGARNLSVHFVSETDRDLVLDLETAFGGRFFPDYRISADFLLDDVPALLDLDTDLATSVLYIASDDIDAIVLNAVIDDTNDNNAGNSVTAHFSATQLPANVNFQLTPASGASLTMSGPVGSVDTSLTSGAAIFGNGLGLRSIEAGLLDVPAKWTANWAGQLRVEAKDTLDNPSPLGQLYAQVSTSNNAGVNDGKLQTFMGDGTILTGSILGGGSGGCRINYTEFLQDIDSRYLSDGGTPNIASRLAHLYCESEQLDPNEDHAIVRLNGGNVDFASLKFSGFQLVQIQPDAGGGNFLLRVPVAGSHPLFVGAEVEPGVFATLQLDNVPDEVVVDLDTDAGALTSTTIGSVGDVDAYYGPLPTAPDIAEAARLQLDNIPTSINVNWDFDIPGSVTYTASNPIEARILAQNGSNRLTGGFVVGNLSAQWSAQLLDVELEYLDPECIFALIPPIGPVCGLTHLIYAEAEFDFTASPGIDGFVNIYDFIENPSPLVPAGADASDFEYVPRMTFALEDFEEFDVEVGIQQCLPTLIPLPPFVLPCLPPGGDFAIGVHVGIDSDVFDNFTFDFWDRGESPGVITDDPDYIEGDPWHVVSPILHDHGDHVDPFDAPLK